MDSMLEPEHVEHFQRWKANPSPDHAASLLAHLDPVIQGAIRTHVGEPNPLIVSRARKLALESLGSYDPSRGRLTNHLYNQLHGLKRIARQQSQVISVPERIAQERYHLEDASHQLESELGRIPTDEELGDRTGLSPRRMAVLRTYRPSLTEGTLDDKDEESGGSFLGMVHKPGGKSLWGELVYQDLDPYHKKVMEHSLGLHGQPVLQNQVLARKLGRSPGAVSQAKLRIQAMLDEEHDLSPF